jgi:hypothetical protein
MTGIFSQGFTSTRWRGLSPLAAGALCPEHLERGIAAGADAPGWLAGVYPSMRWDKSCILVLAPVPGFSLRGVRPGAAGAPLGPLGCD